MSGLEVYLTSEQISLSEASPRFIRYLMSKSDCLPCGLGVTSKGFDSNEVPGNGGS